MKKSDYHVVVVIIALAVVVFRWWIIADDVQRVLNDPNKDDKPGEILKLALDFTRAVG